MKKVLCVAPHPDDETLGCGGTLLKHKNDGDQIHWLIVTNISPKAGFAKSKVVARQKEVAQVAKAYGFAGVHKLDLPTAQLDQVAKKTLIEKIAKVIAEVKPQVVYLPGRFDAHSDHKITFDAFMSVAKTFRAPFIERILMCEIISETEFAPLSPQTAFIPYSLSDISKFLDKKIAIMKMYKGEMAAHPFPRSEQNIRAVATHRGAMAGVKYAEAFMIVKEIW